MRVLANLRKGLLTEKGFPWGKRELKMTSLEKLRKQKQRETEMRLWASPSTEAEC